MTILCPSSFGENLHNKRNWAIGRNGHRKERAGSFHLRKCDCAPPPHGTCQPGGHFVLQVPSWRPFCFVLVCPVAILFFPCQHGGHFILYLSALRPFVLQVSSWQQFCFVLVSLAAILFCPCQHGDDFVLHVSARRLFSFFLVWNSDTSPWHEHQILYTECTVHTVFLHIV